MDRLGLLKTLVTALEEGSLSRAATRLKVTQSAVSQQIRHLEQVLGHQLLLRTPKGVQATRAGTKAAEHARDLLAGYDALLQDLEPDPQHLSGTYRISVGTVLGRSVMGHVILDLTQEFPDLDIVMNMEDRIVDVVRENYDLALRAGITGDSDGFCRKITELETVLVAAPSYIQAQGRPQSPADLQHLKFIRYNEESADSLLPLTRHGVAHSVPVTSGFMSSDPQLTIQALKGGMGFARVVRVLADAHLADGSLLEVLPGYVPQPKMVYAVYPQNKTADPIQKAIIERFLSRIATPKGNDQNTDTHLQLITA